MTYKERLERKAERLDEWAAKREQKASEAHEAAHEIADRIPMGQPVLRGHHSQKAHEKALDRIDAKIGEAVEHAAKAETFEHRADAARKHAEAIEAVDALELEPYQIGDRVTAVFTNSGHVRRYEGEIVDVTLNSWKLRCLTSPYPGDEAYFVEARRVLKAPRKGRPGYTANNRIEGYVE